MPILTKPMIVFPLDQMIAGDSFFVPVYDPHDILIDINRVAHQFRVEVKVVFGIENGFYGARVWRTK